jgi:alkylhydroperoxidase family enzyme
MAYIASVESLTGPMAVPQIPAGIEAHRDSPIHFKGGPNMPLINTITPENAQGTIKEAYDMFMQRIGIIPKPLQLMSASPNLFEIQVRRIQYLSQHPNLSFALLAHIRYLVAQHLDYPFCTDFNKIILKKQGLTEDDIRAIEADPSKSLLEANENAMLAFVVKAVKAPASVTAEEIQRLRDLGWDDRDMMDALSQGVSMIDHSIMMQVFQMDQNCVLPT